jgi:hypothetical protein
MTYKSILAIGGIAMIITELSHLKQEIIEQFLLYDDFYCIILIGKDCSELIKTIIDRYNKTVGHDGQCTVKLLLNDSNSIIRQGKGNRKKLIVCRSKYDVIAESIYEKYGGKDHVSLVHII